MFHHFYGGRHRPGQGSISSRQLEDLIRFVGRGRLLSADEWAARAAADRLDARDVCLTFDDNLRCQHDVALPVLRDYGLTAFWFVATSVFCGRLERLELYRAFRTRYFESVDDFYAEFFRFLATSPAAEDVEEALLAFRPERYLAEFPFYTEADRRFRFVRDEVLGPRRYPQVMDALIASRGVSLESLAANLWMTPEQLRRLDAEGHRIGLHSHTHPTRLAELPIERQRQEYRDNFTMLLSIVGRAPAAVSHPCNSYTAATLEVLRGLGIRVGFRANTRPGPFGPLELPREDHANLLAEMQACASRCSPATSLATSR